MTTPRTRRRPVRRPSPEQYNAFITQIDLRDIWVVSARMQNLQGKKQPEDMAIDIQSKASWETLTGGFTAQHAYQLKVRSGNAVAGEIEVAFAVEYGSEIELTASLFSVFQEINLPLNTWPYLRAFVGDAFAKMGWSPLALPTFKTGNKTEDS